MAEFVTIELGECVILKEKSPVVFSSTKLQIQKQSSNMCRRGSVAVRLCFFVLVLSGILCGPFLVSPLLAGSESPVESVDGNLTVANGSALSPSVTSTLVSPTPSTTTDPHDRMQADNGFLYMLDVSTVSAPGFLEDKKVTLQDSTTKSPPPHPQTKDTENFSRDFHSDNFNKKSDIAPQFDSPVKILCQPTPEDALQLMMGPAFNPRYMSSSQPQMMEEGSSMSLGSPVGGFQSDGTDHRVRHHGSFKHKEFVVDSDYKRDLPKENVHASSSLRAVLTPTESTRKRPSFDIINRKSAADKFLSRIKRFAPLYGSGMSNPSGKPSTEAPSYPWECKSKLVWKDLGEDHFPRFIRTVECLGDKCWFNHFQCRGRAFTVKVLRRRSDQCVPVPQTGAGPTRYEQEWIFEERSVTFCCECVEL